MPVAELTPETPSWRPVLARSSPCTSDGRTGRTSPNRGTRDLASQDVDPTFQAKQLEAVVREVAGGGHPSDAEPRLVRRAGEAQRTHLAHTGDPQYAVSVSQVDSRSHQMDAVYRHIPALPRNRFLLAEDPVVGRTIMAGLFVAGMLASLRRSTCAGPLPQESSLTSDGARCGSVSDEGSRSSRSTCSSVVSVKTSGERRPRRRLGQPSGSRGASSQESTSRTGLYVIFDEAYKLSAHRYDASRKIDKTKRYALALPQTATCDHA